MDNDFIVVADLIPQNPTLELHATASNVNNLMAATELGCCLMIFVTSF